MMRCLSRGGRGRGKGRAGMPGSDIPAKRTSLGDFWKVNLFDKCTEVVVAAR